MEKVIKSVNQDRLLENLKGMDFKVLDNKELAKIKGGWYFLVNWTSFTRIWSDDNYRELT
ncbi:MAG TPA: ComC/BlpC family leader-containing pheromone/bacteriocin [Cyclobacteriaceae bacterium]|nr:ComC/BlpC family leader-containing pheromone/bacteriocin [Cyclobacteriaceae bacterium]